MYFFNRPTALQEKNLFDKVKLLEVIRYYPMEEAIMKRAKGEIEYYT